jgi:hypothetical protein
VNHAPFRPTDRLTPLFERLCVRLETGVFGAKT